tara:strand:+ start:96 stop:365 length:270 start_codon:yes stop_codon:yes gene_type:complete
MDLLEETAACYESAKKLAIFVQVHEPSRNAYLKSLISRPTKKDRQRLVKELETLRLFSETMSQEIRLMGIPKDLKNEAENVESTREKDR